MSEDEKLIDDVLHLLAIQNQADQLYAKFQDLGDLRPKAAAALKTYWMSQPDKWTGKLTKKQKEKAEEIKKWL